MEQLGRGLPQCPFPEDLSLYSRIHSRSYLGTFDSPDEPFLQMTKSAYQLALEFGTRYRIANADTRAAEVWLADHYRAQYRPLNEFAPEATLSGSESLQPIPLDSHAYESIAGLKGLPRPKRPMN